MEDQSFREPITIYAQQPDGVVRATVVASLRQAFRLLSCATFPIGTPEWHIAFQKVSHAILKPKPESVEEARSALNRLANMMLVSVPRRRTVH
jgi:hypothetical protein